jgi:hypothetical protein
MLHSGQNPVHPLDWQSAPNRSLARFHPKTTPLARSTGKRCNFVRPSKIESALLVKSRLKPFRSVSNGAPCQSAAHCPTAISCRLHPRCMVDFCALTTTISHSTQPARRLCKTIISPRG